MGIFVWITVVLGGIVGAFSTLYLIISMFAVLGYKLYRKLKYGMTLYD
ncbi:MAG: hypothetical protein ACI4HQ_06830 [Acetatifactor sp.]